MLLSLTFNEHVFILGMLSPLQTNVSVPPFWHIDQARVNQRMQNHSTPHTLLDAYRFPNGNMFQIHLKDLVDVVALHANWNENLPAKVDMLQKMKLWYSSETWLNST